jgi:small GTP-binding protein
MQVEVDEITFRTVTIGDSSVGKTSIVNRFIHDRFREDEANTIGALYESYKYPHHGRDIEVQIWDTAGQEQYRSLAPVYFRSAAAAIIVFDITSKESFTSVNTWLTCFREASSSQTLIFLVGNKSDLASRRKVEEQDALNWANENGCTYSETSAFNGQGIKDLFDKVALALIQQTEEVTPEETVRTPVEATQEEKSGCC